MGKIVLEGIRVHANHGCLPEEGKIGTTYNVCCDIEFDIEPSALADDLSKTVDYVVVHDLVHREMNVRAKLIEHVARRIYLSIRERYPIITSLEVRVEKFNPPVNGFIEKASVIYNGK